MASLDRKTLAGFAPTVPGVSEKMAIFFGSIALGFFASFLFAYFFGSIRATILSLVVITITVCWVLVRQGYGELLALLLILGGILGFISCIVGTVAGSRAYDKQNPKAEAENESR